MQHERGYVTLYTYIYIYIYRSHINYTKDNLYFHYAFYLLN
uniref:Uncharacterized protein n=1 Tax=Brugia malayi TaxID=6279 RepID=A8NI84_BRUMA